MGELLEKYGHTVIPFTAASPDNEPSDWEKYFPRAADFVNPNPIDIIRYIYNSNANKSIRKLLMTTKVDIAHFHIYYGKLTASILNSLNKAEIPMIQTLHEYKLTCPVYSHLSNDQICEDCEGKHFWRAIPKKCNRGSMSRTVLSVTESYVSRYLGNVNKFDHFISVSHFHRKKMIQYGIPENKITAIHNFTDVSLFDPNYSGGDYILYFGRLHQSKGIFTLINASLKVKELPLYIVGDGEAMNEVRKLIEDNECNHIHILGFKQGDELRELIQNSICTVLPSEWYENCPMSVLESYAYGKAVIGSDIGGIPELIKDKEDGFLIPPANEDELRKCLKWVSDNKESVVEMGKLGRRKIETEFNADIHYERIMDVYNKFL